MSSSRANSSAKQRRAGGNTDFQQQQQGNNNQNQNQTQNQNPKLSISDAIALITLRLGRVEHIVQQLPKDLSLSNASSDTDLMKSILERISNLESNNIESPNQTTQPQNISIQDSESVTTIKEDVISLNEQISGIKDMMMMLQSYTMETNQKLTDIVFSEPMVVHKDLVTNEVMTDLLETINNVDLERHEEISEDTLNMVDSIDIDTLTAKDTVEEADDKNEKKK